MSTNEEKRFRKVAANFGKGIGWIESPHERALKIKKTVRSFGSTMHPSKKAAPGIDYKNLTSKEKHYRKDHEQRTSQRMKKFESSPYGQHLSARAHRRGEED